MSAIDDGVQDTVERNKKPYINEEGALCYSAYFSNGSMMTLREALSPDNPEHLYNHLKSNGITPEDYGVKCPLEREVEEYYGDMSREQLIKLCYNMKKKNKLMLWKGLDSKWRKITLYCEKNHVEVSQKIICFPPSLRVSCIV